MKTKIISLMLVLSCAGASAATALPNSSGDLRALEENRADGDKTAVLTKEETNTDVSGSRSFICRILSLPVKMLSSRTYWLRW